MKNSLLIVLFLCMLVGLAAAYGVGTVVSSFSTESFSEYPIGLTYQGGNLWIIDNLTNDLHELTMEGSLLNTYPVAFAPFSLPNGLTWDADSSVFWCHTGSGATRSLHTLSTSGSILSTIPDCVNYMYAYDAEYLSGALQGIWINDNYTSRTVNRYNTSGSLISSFATTAKYPCGLAYDGTHFLVSGSDDGVTYRYTTSGSMENYFYAPFDPPTFGYSGGTVWVDNHLYWSVHLDKIVYKISIDWNPPAVETTTLGNIRSLYR